MKTPYYIYSDWSRYFCFCIILVLTGCQHHPSVPTEFADTDSLPHIYPDYTDVTIPANIAPLNFMAADKGTDACVAHFTWPGGEAVYGQDNKIIIPAGEWRDMLAAARGGSVSIVLYTHCEDAGKWTRHRPFRFHVSEDEIDPYVSYRLISPSYVGYEMLGIYQRDLTSFDERTIYNNMLVSGERDGQCINCHSYQNYGTRNMQFHMRQSLGGTMIVKDGVPKKVNLKTDRTISAGVYPAWHPTLPLVAYSTNLTGQSFHTKDVAKIEVQDSESDLILYDVEANTVSTISAVGNELEVYPAWNPDGDTLYYASAHFVFNDSLEKDFDAINRYQEMKYDIYCRPFDRTTKRFGEPDTVFSASAVGQSATLPRISPCGRYLLFAMGGWGCFHIWHPDADLYLTDLYTGETRPLEQVNSPQAESYHSWSSNGRWIVLSSRRDDGNYTRLYLAYFDRQGHAHKAFALPQHSPEFYHQFLRSYNVPEFMVEPVRISPQEFAAAARREPVQAKDE
ncbi:MAG: PD40 domain-containing protein [Bacteroidaceae bacterium]|nr:PD40 domain-containing protein [Bacteroidaceae bacterium]